MTDKKTRNELAALVQSTYEAVAYVVGDWTRIVDDLLTAIGYEPAPEPPTYEVGTRADVITVAGVKYAGCAWDGVAWCSSYTRFRNDTIESVEVIPTYDPSRELVIPLDKVPGPIGLRYCAGILDDNDEVSTPGFLRLVADLAGSKRSTAGAAHDIPPSSP